MFKFFKKPSKEFWRALILSAVVGVAAGALGALAVWSSLLAYQTSLVTPNAITSAANRRRAAVVEDELLSTVRDEVSLSVADIFVAKPDRDARYLPTDAVGHGVVLTNDGWIVTHRSVVDPKRKTLFRVGAGPTVSSIDRVVEDTETGTIFLKIKAENLHAAVFGTSSELKTGDRLFVFDGSRRLQMERVDISHFRTTPQTDSDLLESRLSMIPTTPTPLTGAPVLNTHGEIVGIMTADAEKVSSFAVPSDQLTSLFATLFTKGTLSRPSLGIHGISLFGSRSAGGRERGFLIGSDERAGARAIERGSAAERAGLRAGDVMVKFGDTLLNEDQDFSELLLAHKPGEEVHLTIVRAGQESVVAVTLGERESSKTY